MTLKMLRIVINVVGCAIGVSFALSLFSLTRNDRVVSKAASNGRTKLLLISITLITIVTIPIHVLG